MATCIHAWLGSFVLTKVSLGHERVRCMKVVRFSEGPVYQAFLII